MPYKLDRVDCARFDRESLIIAPQQSAAAVSSAVPPQSVAAVGVAVPPQSAAAVSAAASSSCMAVGSASAMAADEAAEWTLISHLPSVFSDSDGDGDR